MLKEHAANGGPVINQPAGHLEAGETLIEAAVRETYEETRWRIKPEAVLSFNLYRAPNNGVTYFRCNFLASALEEDVSAKLDEDIIEALWLDHQSLQAEQANLRSPLVLQAVQDFYSNQRYPLSIINHYLASA